MYNGKFLFYYYLYSIYIDNNAKGRSTSYAWKCENGGIRFFIGCCSIKNEINL